MQRAALMPGSALLFGPGPGPGPGRAACQEHSVRAVDEDRGKPLAGIPISLRYDCAGTAKGVQTKVHCRFIQRKTGADGLVHFPEAGSFHAIDWHLLVANCMRCSVL
jgi:hypothetical protein